MAAGWGAYGGEGAEPRLHIIAAAFAGERTYAAGAVLDFSLLRAARQVLDPMPRGERDGVGGVVLAGAAPAAEVIAAQAHRLAAVMSLREAVAIPLRGLGAQAAFTALHLGRALLGGADTRYVLAASQEVHGEGTGVFLLARAGGIACTPLPSVADADDEGAALAAALERADVGVRSVRAVVAPGRERVAAAAAARDAGLSHALHGVSGAALQTARSVEAALVAAIADPPAARTLIWSADDAGRLSGCLLECEGG